VVAGSDPDAASTIAAVGALATRAMSVAEIGHGAALVLVATPDRVIDDVVVTAAPSLERDALVVHVAGSRGLDVFGPLQESRPDVRVGALHPLQTFPSPEAGLQRLRGSWAAVAGDSAVVALADELGLRPFAVAEADRTRYHAAAVVASNHVVALLGQLERLAEACGAPPEAFAALVEASVDNALTRGAASALTGPVERTTSARSPRISVRSIRANTTRTERSRERRRGSSVAATPRSIDCSTPREPPTTSRRSSVPALAPDHVDRRTAPPR
jgi:predicted short-subunit dehydrogenase-like oxidoreductase (DUF2520 family)